MQNLSDILAIEKAVAKTGVNVLLKHIENSTYYKNFLKQLSKALLNQVRGVAKEGNIERLLMFTKVAEPQLIVELSTIFIKLEELIDLKTYLLRVANATGKYNNELRGITGAFYLTNTELVNYFDDHSKLIINSVDDTTKKWIAERIQKGKDKNLNPREIANMLVDDAIGMSEQRALTIVLTETANAMSVTQRAMAQRDGVKYMIWNTSEDEKVCPICLPLDGKKATPTGAFEGGYAGPPAHPSCRCFMTEETQTMIDAKQWMGE